MKNKSKHKLINWLKNLPIDLNQINNGKPRNIYVYNFH